MPKLIAPSGHALALPRLPCRIGTATTNDVPIQGGLGVAGHHVTFTQEHGAVVIEDSGSGLGTFINGAPVHRQALRGGESVRIGSLELKFEHDGPQASTPGAVLPPANAAVPATQPGEPTTQPGEPATATPAAEAAASSPPSAIPPPPGTTPAVADQRAGLPPVDHRPAEAPLKDLFPKPSQGDSPALGEMAPREKPQPAGATNSRSERKPGPKKLGGLSKPTKKPRRWVPTILVAAAVTIIATAGMLVVDKSESEDSSSTPVSSTVTDPLNHGATQGHDNTHSRLAGLLASLTRPAAVITVDVAALKDRDWTNALPRITNWFENYLKLPIAEVDQIVAVGAAADDFSIAITTSAPLTSATLTERLGPPQAESVYYLDALSGPLAVRLLDDATLIVSHRDNASKPPESAPLPEALERQLQTAAGNVLLTIDHELTDKANTPFFLSPPNDTLKSKTATISVTSLVQLKIATEHSTKKAATDYAQGYGQALAASLHRFNEIDKAAISAGTKSIQSKATEQTAQVFWSLTTSQDQLAQRLIEMIADPLGTEVANASVQVLRQEAQRVAALFYTAKNAGAPLDNVTSTESAIMVLIEGVESSQDNWAGRPFRTRPYSSWEREVLCKFLDFDGSDLNYRPNGIQPEDLDKVIQSKHAATEESTPDPTETKSRLDAAAIAKAYADAKTAGANLENVSKLDSALDELTKGIETDGSRVAIQLSDEERERAKVFLRFQDDKIVLAEAEEE